MNSQPRTSLREQLASTHNIHTLHAHHQMFNQDLAVIYYWWDVDHSVEVNENINLGYSMQTFQLELPANLGISNSTGENPWRFHLKPGDIHFSEE